MVKKYDLEYLCKPGLLQSCFVVTLADRPGCGLHVGFFDKDEFDDIENFYFFANNISSLTQEWFLTKDLETAYEYYYPEDLSSIQSLQGSYEKVETQDLRKWLESSPVLCNLDGKIPYDLACRFFWDEDFQELRIIGESDRAYFEIYIADKVC